MKGKQYKIIFKIIKERFIVLLSNIAINLHPDECSQEFHFQPFAFKLDRCVESCNTFNDLCNKIYVPNKTKKFKYKHVEDDYRNK